MTANGRQRPLLELWVLVPVAVLLSIEPLGGAALLMAVLAAARGVQLLYWAAFSRWVRAGHTPARRLRLVGAGLGLLAATALLASFVLSSMQGPSA